MGFGVWACQAVRVFRFLAACCWVLALGGCLGGAAHGLSGRRVRSVRGCVRVFSGRGCGALGRGFGGPGWGGTNRSWLGGGIAVLRRVRWSRKARLSSVLRSRPKAAPGQERKLARADEVASGKDSQNRFPGAAFGGGRGTRAGQGAGPRVRPATGRLSKGYTVQGSRPRGATLTDGGPVGTVALAGELDAGGSGRATDFCGLRVGRGAALSPSPGE